MNPNKAKGTRWESRLVEYLRANGFPYAERRALAGTKDLGDIVNVPGVVIEAKNTKTINLAEWIDQLVEEKANANARHGAVIFPRRSHRTERAYVVLELEDFVDLIR